MDTHTGDVSPAMTEMLASWRTAATAEKLLSGLDLSAFSKLQEAQSARLAQMLSPLSEVIAKQQAETARLVSETMGPFMQMHEDMAVSFAARVADLFTSIDLEGIQRRLLLPANLPTRYEPLLPGMKRLLEEDGIPLAWVVRLGTIEELLAATSADERTTILLGHADEILEDCADLVADMDAAALADVLPIAREAVEGFLSGKRKIAAVGAVAVTNTVVEQNQWATTERSARKHYAVPAQVDFREFTLVATLAALIVFYREWHPKAPDPMPDSLARHVVSHNLKDEHLSERNCLIAVMLMTSLMQAVQHEAMHRGSAGAT